jgi:alpha-aminoadipic semialdehyde synthase
LHGLHGYKIIKIFNDKSILFVDFFSFYFHRAVEAGVTLVHEVGLDPGLDHLLALECFAEVRQAGGKVESFVSYCGGLPAPEFSDNPLRYKFSWSPRGVLLNTLSSAKYVRKNKVNCIPFKIILKIISY